MNRIEHRRVQILLMGAGALTLAAFLAAAQGPRGAAAGQSFPTQPTVLSTQTNVVLVDVRVWDKSGRPITDLKQQDFRVFDDGVPQKITSFSLEDIEALERASEATGPPPVINLSSLPPNISPIKAIQDHRLVILFFDLTSMPVDDLNRALGAAQGFLSKQMTPPDLVAVATYTANLRVVQAFTNDREMLEKSLQAIRVGEASSLAESGTVGEAGTTNANGEEVVTQDVSAAFTPDETEFNIFNTDEKLTAIESLARMLRDIPGRKILIHFSSGIERTGIENQAQLRAAVDTANQSNVSLYTLDARGLAALPPGGDASSASPAGTAVYSGSAYHSQVSSLEGGRETLATLATDTGGRTFYDLNDFGPAFDEIEKENSTYYLLGYTPANLKADGRFRHIMVEVDRPGAKVQARPGYFAPKNFSQFTREEKENQLEQAMDLDLPLVDLPLAVEADYFRLADRKFYVVLAAKIPASALSFLEKSSRHETELDFAWRAIPQGGTGVAAALRDTLPLKLSGEAYQQVVRTNVLYEGGIELPPGKYTLKVVVRENRSGKMGTFEQPLVLPEMAESGLALSSIVVSNQIEEGGEKQRSREAARGPLSVGSRSILPSVTRVLRTDQHLTVYLESYASAGGPVDSKSAAQAGAAVGPSAALVFFRGGIKISEAGPFPGKMEKSSAGKATYFVQIPLQKFPPGRYWMQVNVLDPSRNRVAFARLPVAIIRPPRATAPPAGR